jgi:hypothetical protein
MNQGSDADCVSDNSGIAIDSPTDSEIVVEEKCWKLEWPEYVFVENDPKPQQRKPKTTNTNVLILRAALKAAEEDNPVQVQEAYDLLSSIASNPTIWRKRYDEIYYKIVQIQSRVSLETYVAMCQATLNEALNVFVYRCNPPQKDSMNTDQEEGAQIEEMSPQEAFDHWNNKNSQLHEKFTVSNSINNEQINESDSSCHQLFPLVAPAADGSVNAVPVLYRNEEAIDQVNEWLEYGCLEESAANHANATFVNKNIAADVSDAIFCILGITSELSPTKALLQYVPNADVIGISRSAMSLIDWYKEEEKQNKIAPNTKLQVLAADILQEYPMIAKWIINTVLESKKSRLILLPMGYMDGEANVRLTLAMDLITMHLIKSLSPGDDKVTSVSNITVVYWTSPATVYVVPKSVAIDSYKRYQRDQKCLANKQRVLKLLSLGQFLQPNSVVTTVMGHKQAKKEKNEEKLKNDSIDRGVILNAATKFQGPNYLLSKMLQQWRCIDLVYNYSNVIVLAPHAPPTRTLSVTHSSQAAAGIEGIPYIAPPNVTFDVATCSTLMTAILLHQVKVSASNDSIDNNDSKLVRRQRDTLEYPFELFWDGSVHGGIWRCPYNTNTVGIPAYLVGTFLLNSNKVTSYFYSNSSQVEEVSSDTAATNTTETTPSSS